MQIVPLQAVAVQTLQAQLGGQACTINLTQTQFAMHMDLFVGGSLVCAGIICENLNRIVRYGYLGFVGDFTFFDIEGTSDPIYTGLGSRFFLVYLAATDLPSS